MPMPLQVQYPDLQQMFGQNSLFSTLYGMNREQQAQANAQQNLGAAQQEQQFEAQMQPYNIQQKQADIRNINATAGNTEAMIPGTQATSGLKQREYQVEQQIPIEQRRDEAMAKIAANISNDQLTAAENHIYQGLNSQDPATRQAAQAALPNIRAIKQKYLELQQQGANMANVAGIEAKSRKDVEQMGINAGKYAKNSLDYLKYKSMMGNYQQQSGYWMAQAAQDAQAAQYAQDPEEKAFYTKRAQTSSRMADLARNADRDSKSAAAYQALAKSPELQQFGINPVVPQASVGPTAGNTADAVGVPQPPASNPNMVLMNDPDGKPHMVPAENVERAKANKWTLPSGAPSIPTK